jgi:hypothetical protein
MLAAPVTTFAEAEGFEVVAESTEIETCNGSDALDRRPQPAAANNGPNFKIHRRAVS